MSAAETAVLLGYGILGFTVVGEYGRGWQGVSWSAIVTAVETAVLLRYGILLMGRMMGRRDPRISRLRWSK